MAAAPPSALDSVRVRVRVRAGVRVREGFAVRVRVRVRPLAALDSSSMDATRESCAGSPGQGSA